MKKINKKDLSLNKETVSGLSNSGSESANAGAGVTGDTCQTFCMQAGCPDHSGNPDDGTCQSFQSVCLCISDNLPCESKVCNPTTSQGPVCCETPMTDECEPYSKACELSYGLIACESINWCEGQTDANTCGVEIITRAGAELSECMCIATTKNCTELNCEG